MVRIKHGSRMLGIAESFKKGVAKKSVLAGVIMRNDLVVDGVNFAFPTIGGLDATEKVLELYEEMGREDVNFLCLSGCVISWFNIVNLKRVYEEISIPVICLTYEESKGLEKFFKEYFPNDYERRIKIYKENGGRVKVKIKTGSEVYVRYFGLDLDDAVKVLNSFTLHGKFPEPIRVARMLAHSLSSVLTRMKLI